MHKAIKITIIVLALISILFFIRFILGGSEDTWICQNGKWIKHGFPSSPMPTKLCGPAVSIEVIAPNTNNS